MKKISIKEAKEISLVKWNFIRNSKPVDAYSGNIHRYMINIFPEYSSLGQHYDCGFCLKHDFTGIFSKEDIDFKCLDCELGKVAGICTESNSMYNTLSDMLDLEMYDNDKFSEEFLDLVDEFIEIIKNIKGDE